VTRITDRAAAITSCIARTQKSPRNAGSGCSKVTLGIQSASECLMIGGTAGITSCGPRRFDPASRALMPPSAPSYLVKRSKSWRALPARARADGGLAYAFRLRPIETSPRPWPAFLGEARDREAPHPTLHRCSPSAEHDQKQRDCRPAALRDRAPQGWIEREIKRPLSTRSQKECRLTISIACHETLADTAPSTGVNSWAPR